MFGIESMKRKSIALQSTKNQSKQSFVLESKKSIKFDKCNGGKSNPLKAMFASTTCMPKK
jgi:hypothetical protein